MNIYINDRKVAFFFNFHPREKIRSINDIIYIIF